MDDAARFLVEDGRVAPTSTSDAAFVEILRPELPRIQRMARLLMGDADVAEDIVADAIARSLPRWRSGDVGDGPAYVRRVVVNLATRRWRRRTLALRRDHHALDWIGQPIDSESAAVERDPSAL